MWCFVELPGMPNGRSALQFGGAALEDGVHAVVEWAQCDDVNVTKKMTDLFTPLTLEVDGYDSDDNEVTQRAFFLANVEAFVKTCIVIPDVGGPANAHFEVKPRYLWANEFIGWLRRPHEEDTMDWEFFEEEKRKLEEEKRKKELEKQAKKLAKEQEKQRKELEKQRNRQQQRKLQDQQNRSKKRKK